MEEQDPSEHGYDDVLRGDDGRDREARVGALDEGRIAEHVEGAGHGDERQGGPARADARALAHDDRKGDHERHDPADGDDPEGVQLLRLRAGHEREAEHDPGAEGEQHGAPRSLAVDVDAAAQRDEDDADHDHDQGGADAGAEALSDRDRDQRGDGAVGRDDRGDEAHLPGRDGREPAQAGADDDHARGRGPRPVARGRVGQAGRERGRHAHERAEEEVGGERRPRAVLAGGPRRGQRQDPPQQRRGEAEAESAQERGSG